MNFSDMVGKVIKSIDGAQGKSERVVFNFSDGTAWVSYHSQDCCESVSVERVDGRLGNAIGSVVLEASEDYDSKNNPPVYADSWTWTYQKIRTQAGEVCIVWLGESNGYYGETPYLQITHGAAV